MKAKVLLGLGVLLVSSAQAQAASFKVNGGGIAVIALDNSDDELSLSMSGGGVGDCGPVDVEPLTLAYTHNGTTDTLDGVKGLTVLARGGDNNVTIDGGGLTLEKNIRIVSTNGMDEINVNGLSTCGTLTVVTGAGDDMLTMTGVSIEKNTNLNTGKGDDAVDITELMANRTFRLITHRDNDTVAISDSMFGVRARAYIHTAAGDDEVTMSGNTVVRHLSVLTVGGADTVKLTDNTFENTLSVKTGGQDDEVTVTGNTSINRTVLNGASGADELLGFRQEDNGNNQFPTQTTVRGFEFFDVPVESERIFAIAYTNLDGIDGFDEDEDVLIAKWIDGPETGPDGVSGPGDIFQINMVPSTFELPYNFRQFGDQRHEITFVFDGDQHRLQGQSASSDNAKIDLFLFINNVSDPDEDNA